MDIGPARVEPLPGHRIRLTRVDGTGPAIELPAACLACLTRTRACPRAPRWRRWIHTLARLLRPGNSGALGGKYRRWRQSQTEGLQEPTYVDTCHWR